MLRINTKKFQIETNHANVNRKTLLITIIEKNNKDEFECDQCLRKFESFVKCVTINNYHKNSYSNCVYDFEASRCTFRNKSIFKISSSMFNTLNKMFVLNEKDIYLTLSLNKSRIQ